MNDNDSEINAGGSEDKSSGDTAAKGQNAPKAKRTPKPKPRPKDKQPEEYDSGAIGSDGKFETHNIEDPLAPSLLEIGQKLASTASQPPTPGMSQGYFDTLDEDMLVGHMTEEQLQAARKIMILRQAANKTEDILARMHRNVMLDMEREVAILQNNLWENIYSTLELSAADRKNLKFRMDLEKGAIYVESGELEHALEASTKDTDMQSLLADLMKKAGLGPSGD